MTLQLPKLDVPVLTADAATDGSTHAKKHTKKVQRHLVTQTARDPGKSPFPPMDEDMDRKRASGGGGY